MKKLTKQQIQILYEILFQLALEPADLSKVKHTKIKKK